MTIKYSCIYTSPLHSPHFEILFVEFASKVLLIYSLIIGSQFPITIDITLLLGFFS